MISIFVPALNEERQISKTLDSIMEAAAAVGLRDYEILAFDDGSTDATGRILDEYAAKHPCIRAIHNPTNLGVGVSFHEAVRLARYDLITGFAGDNNCALGTMEALLAAAGTAEVVIVYFVNTELRSRLRNLLSVIFSTIYVTLFDLHVKYVHGNFIFPVPLLRSLRLRSRGYSCYAEMTVKLLRSGVTFYELPGYMNTHAETSSQALRLKTLTSVVKDLAALAWEIYVSDKGRFDRRPRRIIPARPTERAAAGRQGALPS